MKIGGQEEVMSGEDTDCGSSQEDFGSHYRGCDSKTTGRGSQVGYQARENLAQNPYLVGKPQLGEQERQVMDPEVQ